MEITLKILRDYLDTLGMDDEAGIVANAFECPFARAARHHYKKDFVVTQEEYYQHGQPTDFRRTPTEVAVAINSIDRAKGIEQPITRQEVEHAIFRSMTNGK